MNELNTNLHKIIDKAKTSYESIELSTGIKMHNLNGLDNFKEKIGNDVSLFMEFSRGKAEKAQLREFVTLQPKESLATVSKAKITISNYLGGKYFLTVDEILLTDKKVSLIEGKHTKNSLLPSKGDIKDGLLKMILYSNLCEVFVNGKEIPSEAILCLTSAKLKGAISSESSQNEIIDFLDINKFSLTQKHLIETVIAEARQNNFVIKLQFSK